MLNRNHVLFLSFVIFFGIGLIFLGCDRNPTEASRQDGEPVNLTFIGSWSKNLENITATIAFNFPNTFQVFYSTTESQPVVEGQYTLSGTNQINLTDNACGNISGSYSYSILGTNLTFSSVSDGCSPRKAVIEGVWAKK